VEVTSKKIDHFHIFLGVLRLLPKKVHRLSMNITLLCNETILIPFFSREYKLQFFSGMIFFQSKVICYHKPIYPFRGDASNIFLRLNVVERFKYFSSTASSKKNCPEKFNIYPRRKI